MNQERRRYFRINDTVGLSYSLLSEAGDPERAETNPAQTLLGHLTEQDKKIESVLIEVAQDHPKVAELVRLFNQKLERVVNLLSLEGKLLEQIAVRVREVNISACGIAFINEEQLPVGTPLKLEISLLPSESTLATQGRVVGCDPTSDEGQYYVRIDFYGMKNELQEMLIQHIVKNQNLKLKESVL